MRVALGQSSGEIDVGPCELGRLKHGTEAEGDEHSGKGPFVQALGNEASHDVRRRRLGAFGLARMQLRLRDEPGVEEL